MATTTTWNIAQLERHAADGTFTEAHISELGAALAAGNLDGIYTLT